METLSLLFPGVTKDTLREQYADSGGEISHPLGSLALPAGCVIGARSTRVRRHPSCLASVQIKLRE